MNKREARRVATERKLLWYHPAKTFSRMIPTPDNWSPSFVGQDGGIYVECRIRLLGSTDHPDFKPQIHIIFSGNDDTYLERKIGGYRTYEQAERAYEASVAWASKLALASMASLDSLGFTVY